ncbi:MAG TPA: YfiR family protein [Noviherbaspirillum sp.]|nr:YfiR family protein [Noviherbaspirillum sp.]
MTSDAMARMMHCVAVAMFLLPSASYAQRVPEYELKAAFAYNFVLFTEWPADTVYEGGTLNICINPNSAMRPSLNSLQGKPAKGRKILIRALAVPDDIRSCHVLFIDSTDSERWLQIERHLRNASVLTISDEDGSPEGGIIELSSDGNRVVFDIDMKKARNARLVLSSKLLRLARAVQ